MTEASPGPSLYDSFLQFLPVENLAPSDRRAVLDEMAHNVVRVVALGGSTSRHDVLERLTTDFGYLPSDAGAAVLHATDQGFLVDRGMPSQLMPPDEA